MKRIDLYQMLQLAWATLNTQQGGHLRPIRNYEAWVNEISLELYNEKVADWEKNQVLDDTLAVSFLRTVNVSIQAATGRGFDTVAYPEDYGAFSSMRILKPKKGEVMCELPRTDCMDCKSGKIVRYIDPDDAIIEKAAKNVDYSEINLNKVDNQRWGSALDHKLKKPSISKPIATQFDKGFKIAPQGLGIVVLDYFKQPQKAKFAYNLDSEDRIIYDLTASIQLEWTDLVLPEFISRLKKRYGSFTGQVEIYNQGEAERKQTK